MKLKKLLISASAITAGAGLLATVLTSCSKEDIDEDLKIELNSEGKLVNIEGSSFKDAIRAALGRSSSWATFKEALAEEIVFKWYENRASKDKNDTNKNTTFRSNIDEWKYDIDKEYDDTVDNLKSKYGANYKFYLQNEQLSVNGGTEETYKHAKLVEKVKAKFIEDAFSTIYFGHKTADSEDTKYPHIFASASLSVDERKLNDPTVWENLGFYAKTSGGFEPGTKMADADINYLSRHLDGDYATLQDYVFNRWFKTEKPFFSAAALFKYSAPNSTPNNKLSDVYNSAVVTVPDAPNEAFPFFGGQSKSDAAKGTLAFYNWYNALASGKFEDGGQYYDTDGKTLIPNGTTTIPSEYTEDSQTLLLSYGSKMIGGTDGALYIPYAISAASLYLQMFGDTTAIMPNTMQQKDLAEKVGKTSPSWQDDTRLLDCFISADEPKTFKSYLDLNSIYGGLSGTEYHCPIFNKEFTQFYGAQGTNGVRYVSNNFQTTLAPSGAATRSQPWILELNEAGVHAQTIDGYQYVAGEHSETDYEALKNVVKYRLMQKKCGYNDKLISADLLDNNGKLKTYFTDNFANIILEMAMDSSTTDNHNIFRTVESYKETTEKNENLFLYNVCKDQNLATVYDLLTVYITATISFETDKKNYDAINTANDKIYAYRTTQIANSKDSHETDKKVFENGLLAPIPLSFTTTVNSTHDYSTINKVIYFNETTERPTLEGLLDSLSEITTTKGTTFINAVCEQANVDGNMFGFAPQVKAAKDVQSNRYWYLSPIVDKLMYGHMGDATVANSIKQDTYTKYVEKLVNEGTMHETMTQLLSEIGDAMDSTYYASKLLTGDKNFASYAPANADFFTTMETNFSTYIWDGVASGGIYNSDITNYEMYKTTIVYLLRDNFTNLYNTLNSRIHNDESAFVGYVNKFDISTGKYRDADSPVLQLSSTDERIQNYYTWTANVDNIYDEDHYAGGGSLSDANSGKISYDQYWHVVNKMYEGSGLTPVTFAGFTGLQTKENNQIDSSSGLQDAAFDGLAKATVESPILNTTSTTDKHAQNDGALFAWAGQYEKVDDKGQGTEYTFPEITNPEDSTQKINPSSFTALKQGLKLARSIANSDTIQDLRDLGKSLGKAIDGDSFFKHVGDGSWTPDTKDPVNELKYEMLEELLKEEGGKKAYAHMFERLVNVELHGSISEAGSYCFRNGFDGYKLMLTQINKADVIEKKITPTYVEDPGNDKTYHWEMREDAGITLDEFWYVLCHLATESSVQQSAVADAVKEIYGPNKLVVYDAQLYNQFDSVWIKDWVRKPIGA